MVSYFIREISEDLVNQQSSSVHSEAYVQMCFGSLVCVPNKDYVEMVFNSLVFVNNKVHLEMCFRGVVGL